MILFRSWKESLLLFVPKNMKLFLLVTLKSALETYSFLIYYFWWLLLLTIVFDLGCYYPECMVSGTMLHIASLLANILLLFTLFTLARPSIAVKNRAYWYEQLRKSYIGFTCLYIILFGMRQLLGILLIYICIALCGLPLYDMLSGFFMFVYGTAPMVVIPVFTFAELFFLDSTGSCKGFFLSIWRGFVMFIYNAPFCMISVIFLYLVWEVMFMLFGIYRIYLFFPFIPFMLSYFKNMYVKRLHDQFNLYFSV